MALQTEQAGRVFVVEPLPLSPTVEQLADWTYRHLILLQNALQRLEIPALVLSQVQDATNEQLGRVQPGLVLYAAAGAIGANEGYYVQEGGAWKKITTV